jgi:DNA polymerase-1
VSKSPLQPEQLVAVDFETHRVQRGLLAPPIVVGSRSYPDGRDEIDLARVALDRLAELLNREGLILAGANIAFDMACACASRPDLVETVFAKFERGEIFDVSIAATLDAIARGHLGEDPSTGGPIMVWSNKSNRLVKSDQYSLETCVRLWLGRTDAKSNDEFKLRYHELEGLPIEAWPDAARQYPKDDTRNTFEVAAEQVRKGFNLGWIEAWGLREKITHMTHQARAAFSMHLASCWGVRTDGEHVEQLAAKLEEKRKSEIERFKDTGFIRADGTENQAAVKRAVALAYGASGQCPRCNGTGKVPSPKTGKPIICKVYLDEEKEYHGCDGTALDLSLAPSLPRAEKGGVSASRDTLGESGDDVLEGYAEVSATDKLIDTYVPFLRAGVSRPITLEANVLVESGRASYRGLIQLLPRKGGVRDAFIERPGWVMCSTDYSALELCTLAQVCLKVVGWSKMADAINASGDPGALHTLFGARMLDVDPDEFKRRVKAKDPVAVGGRQMSKAANFGFPGLMGGCKLAITKRKEGLRFCIESGRAPACPDCEGWKGNVTCRRCYGRGALCGVDKVTTWGFTYEHGNRKPRRIPPTCRTCIEIAEQLKLDYLSQWEEMPEYFKWVQAHEGMRRDCAIMVSPGSGYIRGGLNASSGSNHPFQHLASMGAKHALWHFTRECYADRRSVLYGNARPLVFAHDEVISAVRVEVMHECAVRQAQILVESMREFVPDVAVGCEPALMWRWLKDAEPVKDASGRYVPWEPPAKKSGEKQRERYVCRA